MATPSFTTFVRTATASALVLSLTACMPGTDSPTPTANPTTSVETEGDAPENSLVRVVVHDSFQLSDELKAQFEQQSGYTLEVVTNGDGGALVNKLVLTKDAPLGDVAYGVDNTFASRALSEGVFEEYVPATEGALGAELRLSDGKELTPIDFGDVCLNIDSDYYATVDLAEPLEQDGFFNPAHAGSAVVTNPATSSPGLAFLFATIAKYGEDGYLDYWKQLKDNGLKIVDGWEDAYYVDFSFSGGDRPVVLSYASSPAFTATEDGSRTSTETLMSTCYRQVEYAGVLAGGANPEGAQAFIDFLISDEFQSTIADTMYMYPVSETAEIPEEWASFAPVPDAPATLEPALIDQKRDDWIKEWSAEILG